MRYPVALCLLLLAAAACGQTNPVTNGSFEELDERGFPVDWSPVSEFVRVTDDAHTGQRALRFDRPGGPKAPPEVGLNRAWAPNTGTQGRMLSETRGGLVFWYKVIAAGPGAELSAQVIPMDATGVERTGEPRILCRLPREHAGDGQWHEGRLAYDFSNKPAVKWVHVGVRLTGGPASLIVDDMRYVERTGPILRLEKVRVIPDAARPGRAALLTAMVTNAGDAPTGAIRVRVHPPGGLRAAAVPPVPALPADGATRVKCRLSGVLRPGAVRVVADDGASQASGSTDLAPKVALLSFLAQPGLCPPGGTARVVATVQNTGTATARGLRVAITVSGGVRLGVPAVAGLPPVPPGGQRAVSWVVRVMRAGEHRMRAALHGAGGATEAASGSPGGSAALETLADATVVATDALTRAAERLTPLLWVRRGSDRTVGELRAPGVRGACARLPHLGRVTVRLSGGGIQALPARYGRPAWGGKGAALESAVRDRDGGVWRFRAVAEAVSRTATRLRIEVRCSQPRTVLLFEGPMFLAGDGTTGAAKREAIFPGLEWLTPDEVSSSDLDIAASHPDRLRYVPHPHKVTIPAVGVRTPAATVGLLWDVHARWDGRHFLPQPVFAVPDRLLGTAAHRLGLVAPNVPNGLPENSLYAKPGYRLPAGQPLALAAVLIADPRAPDSLSVVDAWFRHYRPDPVLPAPRGSDRAQVAWSMQAYMKSLWVSPREGWLPYLSGPALWRKPAPNAAYAYDLAQAARILPGHSQAREWRRRVAQVLPAITRPQAEDLGFAGPDALVHLGSVAARAYELISTQRRDGTWRFDADLQDQGVFKGMDYHDLGPDEAAEVGTIARSAYEVLLYARLSGDSHAYRAGVKALERIARFRVPRAAQVWEVPVHTPDILAAADAVDAFIEAYRYTQRGGGRGEARWLREARRWARAGLPFVYVWSASGKPWMRYGSIPVFGATWFQGSWFGNIVQWNGLRYAYALIKLYEHDPGTRWDGLSWRDLGLGLTRCAMYQQATRGENLGLWPDSYHTITNVRAQWDFAPRQILKNVFALMGRGEEPRTVAVAGPGGVARVSALGRAVRARWEGHSLRVNVRREPGEGGSVVIAGVTRPSAVHLNGIRVAQRTPGSVRGWQYDADRRLLAVPADGEAPELVVRGVRCVPARAAAAPIERIAFEFTSGAEGWVSAHDLAPLEVARGALVVRVTGIDPYMHRYVCRIAGSGVREVVLRLRGTGDGAGQLFWTTQASPGWEEAKSVRFHFPTDGRWHEVAVPVSGHPLWRGHLITALRLDLGATPGSRVMVDWIRGR